MKRLAIITYLALVCISMAFGQVHPVSSSLLMPFPHPIYLSEYSDPASMNMQVTLKLNDYSVSSLDVKLKFVIDNGDVVLSTKDDYVPTKTLTLIPGVPLILKGSDLYDALNITNLNLEGISVSSLAQNGGKLPEGQYTFCVKVLETSFNREISLESCNIAFLELQQPPMLLTPENEVNITPSTPQNLQVNWQMAGAAQPILSQMVTFKLHVYEVTVPTDDARNSVENSKAVKIYESQPTTFTTINLDFSTVLLTVGKQYVYRVQAIGPMNKNIFDNEGYSEWNYFNYGYPEGGIIELDKPFDAKQFEKSEQKIFSWGGTDKGLDGQPFVYEIIMVEEEDTSLTAEESLLRNPSFHEEKMPVVQTKDGGNFFLSKALNPDKKYLWKIDTYSGEQKVAESEARSFYSHSLIKEFYASNRPIKVTQITTPDLEHLAGKARIQMSDDEEDFVDVTFKNLKIKVVAGEKILEEGEIHFDLSGRDPLELEANVESNGIAMFEYQSGHIDKYGLKVDGKINWVLPHAVLPGESQNVYSKPSTFVMNTEGVLSGEAGLEPYLSTLIAPKDFTLSFKETSLLQVSDNKFDVNLVGHILLPETIKTISGQRLKIAIKNHIQQLDYIEIDNLIGIVSGGVAPFKNLKMEFIPIQGGVIDFSEDVSPGKLSSDKGWKGFYVTDFKVRCHNSGFDESRQITLTERQDFDFSTEGSKYKFWIASNGLTLKNDIDFTEREGVEFNSFKAIMAGDFDIKNNEIKKAQFDGFIKIPFVGDTEKFTFEIQATTEGLEEGFLNEDLTERDLVFNPFGVENKMNVKINRAVFENNEYLKMNLEVQIPELAATIESISDFRVYGDNFIGASGKNAAITLDNFVKGKFKNVELSITEFGGAYLGGAYALSYKAETFLSEGFSGEDGPPELSISSVAETTVEPGEDAVIPAPAIEVPEGLENETAVKPAGIDLVIETPIIDGDAKLLFTANDPTWGTKFEGGLNVNLKMPMALKFGTNMTLGITPELMDYWYFDAYFEDKSSTGIPVYEPVSLFTTGAMVKLFNITGMEGKIFRHMRGTQDSDGKFSIDMDPEVMFGMGLYAQVIDPDAKGFLFQADLGIEGEMLGEGFIPSEMRMSMSGQASFLNFNVRTGVSAKQMIKEAAPEVAEAVADAAAGVVFPVEFELEGTKVKINSTGFDNGSLAIGDYDGGNGFKVGANVSSKPSVEVGLAQDNFKMGGSADAAGSGSFEFGLGSDQIAAKMEKMNSAEFDLNISGLVTSFSGDIEKKKGAFAFDYEATKLSLGVDANAQTGHIDVNIDDFLFIANTDVNAQEAYIGFEMDDNKFKMAVSGDDKAASLLAEIEGVELNTGFDINEKQGNLFFSTSSEEIELKGSPQEALFRVESGSDIVMFESQFEEKTGKINLTFPNNQLKGEIATDFAEIFMKQSDFEIGLMGKYDGTGGNIHLKEGDFGFDLGADISQELGYLNLKKGSTEFASRYNLADSSFVTYNDDNISTGVKLAGNNFTTYYADNDNDIFLFVNPDDVAGRMKFEIPEFGFDGAFNAAEEMASLNFRVEDSKVETYYKSDSAIVRFTEGQKEYKVAGTGSGSGQIYYADNSAGIATGFGFNKEDQSGSLLFKNGDLLIDIATNNTENTGSLKVENGGDIFHAAVNDSVSLRTKIEDVEFAGMYSADKTAVFFGVKDQNIGITKLNDGGHIRLQNGELEIGLGKKGTDYSTRFNDGTLDIATLITAEGASIDFKREEMGINASVASGTKFSLNYTDDDVSSGLDGNINDAEYLLSIATDGWEGKVDEKFNEKSTRIDLSKSGVAVGIDYTKDLKALTLNYDEAQIVGGIESAEAFLNANYGDLTIKAKKANGVAIDLQAAQIKFPEVFNEKYYMDFEFSDNNFRFTPVEKEGKHTLDVTHNGEALSFNPENFAFDFEVEAASGHVEAAYKEKSAKINMKADKYDVGLEYNANNKMLSFKDPEVSISGGVKEGTAFLNSVYEAYSFEYEHGKQGKFTSDLAEVKLDNFHNDLYDIEFKVDGKKVVVKPNTVNGEFNVETIFRNNTLLLSKDDIALSVSESGWKGTFHSQLNDKTNTLSLSKKGVDVFAEVNASKKMISVSKDDFKVQAGQQGKKKLFGAGFKDLYAEVNSKNQIIFNFNEEKIEINNFTNKQFEIDALIGTKNIVVKPQEINGTYALDIKINGEVINEYEQVIEGKLVSVEKKSDTEYVLSISEGSQSLRFEYEANQAPKVIAENDGDTYEFELTEEYIAVNVNNIETKYLHQTDELQVVQGYNLFSVNEKQLLATIENVKLKASETQLQFEQDDLILLVSENVLSVEKAIGDKSFSALIEQEGGIMVGVKSDDLAIIAKYAAGENPGLLLDKAGQQMLYEISEEAINIKTDEYEVAFDKATSELLIAQGDDNTFQVSEEQLAVTVNGMQVALSEKSLLVEKEGILTYIDDEMVRMQQKIGDKTLALELSESGSNRVAFNDSEMALVVDYANGESPKAEIVRGDQKLMFSANKEEVTIGVNEYMATLNPETGMVAIATAANESFSVSNEEVAVTLLGYALVASEEKFEIENNDVKTLISEEAVELLIADKAFKVNTKEELLLQLDENSYLKTSPESVELSYDSKTLLVNEQVISVEDSKNGISGAVTEEGVAISMDAYKLMASADQLHFEGGDNALTVSQESIEGKYKESTFAITADRSISYKDADRSLTVSEESLAMEYQGVGLAITEDKVSISHSDMGEFTASKDELRYNGNDVNVAITDPFSVPNFAYKYGDASIELTNEKVAIEIADKKLIAGKKDFGVQLDSDHRMMYVNKNLDFKYEKYEASFTGYNDLHLSNGVQSFAISDTELEANLDSDNGIKTYMVDNLPGMTLTKDGNLYDISPNGAQFTVAGFDFSMNAENYIKVQKEDADGDDGLYVNSRGMQYIYDKAELRLGTGERVMELLYDNSNSLAFTKSQELVFTIDDDYVTKVKKDLSVEFTKDDHLIEINKADFMAGYTHKGLDAKVLFKKFDDGVGVKAEYDQYSSYLKGNKDSQITVGVESEDYGGFEFSANAKKDITMKGLKSGTNIVTGTLKGGKELTNLLVQLPNGNKIYEYNSEVDIMGETVAGVESVEMDGPAHLSTISSEAMGWATAGVQMSLIASKNPRIVMNGRVQSGLNIPILCANAPFGAQIGKDGFMYKLADRNQTADIKLICALVDLPPVKGFAKFEVRPGRQTSFDAALGMSFNMAFNGGFTANLGLAKMKCNASISSGFEFLGDATMVLPIGGGDASFSLNAAFVDLHAKARVTGSVDAFGFKESVDASAAVHGRLEMKTTDSATNLSGKAQGSVKIGELKKGFDFDVNFDI